MALVRHAHAAADPVLDRLVQLLIADQLDFHGGLPQEAEPAGFGERQAVEEVEAGHFPHHAPELLDDVRQGQDVGGQVQVMHPPPVADPCLLPCRLPGRPLRIVNILVGDVVAEGSPWWDAVAGEEP